MEDIRGSVPSLRGWAEIAFETEGRYWKTPPGMDSADYVLDVFDRTEQSLLDQILSQAAESLKSYFWKDFRRR